MLRPIVSPALVGLATLALTACGGGDDGGEDAGGGGDAATSIEVTGMDDLAFSPTSFTVPAGEEVTVELTAEAGVEHDFVVEDLDGGDVEVAAADAGTTGNGTFTAEDAGSYTFYCSVPGHREAGMEGSLEVVDS